MPNDINVKNWYVISVKNGLENRICKILDNRKITYFHPFPTKINLWGGIEKDEQPEKFPPYLFIFLSEDEKMPLIAQGAINFVYFFNKPVVIPDSEVNGLKQFIDQSDDIEVEKMDVSLQLLENFGEKIAITAFDNILDNGQKRKLSMPSLGYIFSGSPKKKLAHGEMRSFRLFKYLRKETRSASFLPLW